MLGPCKSHPYTLSRSILFIGHKAFSDARSITPKLVGNTYRPEIFSIAANSAAATTNVSADANGSPIGEHSTHLDSSAGSEPK